MHKLIFVFENSLESFSLNFNSLDFMNFAKVGDIIRIKKKSYCVEEVKVERTIESTHPMIEPPGFDLVVNMTMIISEVS